MTATTNTPALVAELRHATDIIHRAACTTTPTTADEVAAAQHTLTDNQHRTCGALRDALDTYLADTTWHQGPFILRQAIIDLARQLDIHHPDPIDDVVHQLQLFDSD